MNESSRLPPALKRVRAIVLPRKEAVADLRPLGVAAVDHVLGGGLAAGRLHEVFAREPQAEASAMGFTVMLALRLLRGAAGPGASPLLWLREEAAQQRAGLCGAGLAELGLDPARLILGVLPDARALLRAGVDALRCMGCEESGTAGGLGVVIFELSGNPALLDLTASRRLALAAERSGVTPLLLRLRGANPSPSAAQTRWAVGAACSAPLAARAPGHPALAVTLLRQRGGAAGFDWELEWDRDAVAFRQGGFGGGRAGEALSGARLPLSGGGSVPSSGTGSAAAWGIAV